MIRNLKLKTYFLREFAIKNQIQFFRILEFLFQSGKIITDGKAK